MTGTEVEDQVRELLQRSALGEPAPPPLDDVLASCQRDLRRHRRRSMVAAAALLVLVAATPAALVGVTHRPAHQEASNRGDELTNNQIIKECRNGNQDPQMTSFMYNSGTPTIQAKATVADIARIILVSADKHYWADCFINLYKHPEFSAGMTVQNTSDTTKGTTVTAGFTCKDLDGPPAPRCPTFFVAYVDRLLSPVAAVQFLTADGITTTVRADDGFILFTHTGPVPTEYSHTQYESNQPFLERVTYLDSDNQPLAAQNLATAKRGQMHVGDLPLLKAYPSQRSGPVGVDPSGHGPNKGRPSQTR